MLRAGLTFVAILTLRGTLLAQGAPMPPGARQPLSTAPVAGKPAQPLAAQPVAAQQWSPQLAAHIQAWEKKNQSLVSLYTDAEVIRTNTIKQKDTPYDAVIMCMKPNLARMHITNRVNKADYTSWICDGTIVCEYDSLGTKFTQHSIPPGGKGGVGDNRLLEFMSGHMTGDDIKQRFVVTLDKEDENYIYLRIMPRLEKDQLEFEKMTVVLYGPKLASRNWDYLPAVVLFTRNDGQETEKWTFKEPKLNNPGVKKEQFVPTDPPKGWTKEYRRPNVGPKVARP